MNTEVNGPANILMILEAFEGNLTAEHIKMIQAEALKTVEYIKSLSNPSNVRWQDIKSVKTQL